VIPQLARQESGSDAVTCLPANRRSATTDRESKVFFRLYIAGDSVNSYEAQANLQAICSQWLPQRHDIEVVDVFREPIRALEERVMMTPTLIRLGKPPLRIVGTLNEPSAVMQALGLGGTAS
jgi:circadian clock protein KaiB